MTGRAFPLRASLLHKGDRRRRERTEIHRSTAKAVGIETIVLDRRRFLALSSLAALSASAPAAPAAAWELADAQRLVLDNRERGVRIIGSRGEFVAARGAYYGPPVPFRQLPPHLVNAVVASEDRRFHEHFGIDPQSLARAFGLDRHRADAGRQHADPADLEGNLPQAAQRLPAQGHSRSRCWRPSSNST